MADGADNAFTDGATFLLMGRYINGTATAGDRLDLIGDNTGDADALPPTFDPTDPNAEFAFALTDLDIALERISAIQFTIRGLNNNFIDELRIGSTYGSVAAVPEPIAAILVLFGVIVMAAYSRRSLARNVGWCRGGCVPVESRDSDAGRRIDERVDGCGDRDRRRHLALSAAYDRSDTCHLSVWIFNWSYGHVKQLI